MHTLIRNILDRRLVSLVGEDGVGKSAVSAAVCKYLADRDMFHDGVVYLRAKGLNNFKSFLSGLQNALLNSGTNTVAQRFHTLLNNSTSTINSNYVYPEEELIFSCLEPLKLLLVIDNLDDLFRDYGDSITDLRIFLTRLFEQCHHIKLLIVSTDTLNMHNINIGFGIIEYSGINII